MNNTGMGYQAGGSTIEKIKNMSLGGAIGGGAMMIAGSVLFLKTVRSRPTEQRKAGPTLMRAAGVVLIAAGAAVATTSTAVNVGSRAIERSTALRALMP